MKRITIKIDPTTIDMDKLHTQLSKLYPPKSTNVSLGRKKLKQAQYTVEHNNDTMIFWFVDDNVDIGGIEWFLHNQT